MISCSSKWGTSHWGKCVTWSKKSSYLSWLQRKHFNRRVFKLPKNHTSIIKLCLIILEEFHNYFIIIKSPNYIKERILWNNFLNFFLFGVQNNCDLTIAFLMLKSFSFVYNSNVLQNRWFTWHSFIGMANFIKYAWRAIIIE